MSVAELTTFQQSNMKKLEKLRSIGGHGLQRFLLIKDKKALVLRCSKALEGNREEKLQEIIDFFHVERGDNSPR
jgi:hypothetical protein